MDPIIEEGLKWLEDNDDTDVETYKNKQKELEAIVNPLMQKLYSSQTPPEGMPEGMAEEMAAGMAEGMAAGMAGPTIDEVD